MSSHEALEKSVEKSYAQKDHRKRKRMHQSGKSVFQLKKIIAKKSK